MEETLIRMHLFSSWSVPELTADLSFIEPRVLCKLSQASPREAIHDVRQSIVESTETCIHSCFSLAFNGTKLNDFMELGDVEGITPDSELDLILSKNLFVCFSGTSNLPSSCIQPWPCMY